MYTENEKDLKLWNTAIYREIDNIAPDVDIIFNCKSMCEIDAMFYSSKNVYAWFPPENTIDSLKNIGYKLGAFASFDSQKLPEYIVEDNDIPVSYTHLRAHETVLDLVCRLLLEKKKIHICSNHNTFTSQKHRESIK